MGTTFLSLLLVVISAFRFAYTCSTDLDCSLNGVCRGGTCACRKPWTGGDCGLFKFLPAPNFPSYGTDSSVTAWGGNVMADEKGTYHLFVAEMALECPLSTWGQNSFCRHATANSIEGPYVAKDIAVDVWCHNPQVVKLQDGTFALFHIGSGSGGNPRNCTKSEIPQFKKLSPLAGSSIHISKSLDGPWQPLSPNPLPSCNNPAPFVARNGTIFIVCDGVQFYYANSIHGPWNHVSSVSTSGGPSGNYEDPFLWIDQNGNFHVLYHVYNTHQDRQSCVNSTVSAHVASVDGRKWRAGPNQPYTTQVQLKSGKTVTVSTRERPKMYFDNSGTETYLFNAVCSIPACPNGPPTGCVDCKLDNWDYWLAQGFDLN